MRNLEGLSVIFTMQVEPGAVAVVPGLIGTMQAKGPALPSAQQPPAPFNSGVQICVNFIVMIEGLQGLECKIVCLLPLPSFSSFSSPSSSLLFLLPHPSCLLLLRSTNTKKSRGARRCGRCARANRKDASKRTSAAQCTAAYLPP